MLLFSFPATVLAAKVTQHPSKESAAQEQKINKLTKKLQNKADKQVCNPYKATKMPILF
jgi:hypothetical protein